MEEIRGPDNGISYLKHEDVANPAFTLYSGVSVKQTTTRQQRLAVQVWRAAHLVQAEL